MKWPVWVLIAFFLLQGTLLIGATSPTADEVAFHMVNGYVYLLTQDYRMSPANPALIREWMALPWLLMKPKIDLSRESWSTAESVPFAVDFFYKDNRSIAGRLLTSARLMNLLLGLAMGLLVFFWSQALYGLKGGILSFFFYVTCPNVLAHSALATTDIGVSLFVVASFFSLWRYLQEPKHLSFWTLCACVGLACAAKYNALYIVPLILGIVGWKMGARVFLKACAGMAVLGFFIIWASYFFEFRPILYSGVPRIEEKLSYIPAGWGWLKETALNMSVPIPSYVLGLAGIVRSHQSPYLHFAFGRWTTDTVWWYYLFVFSIKMTLPFLGLLLLRGAYFKKAGSAQNLESVIILSAAISLFVITFRDTTAVGIRYLLLVIPLLYVWVGGLANVAAQKKNLKIVLMVAMAAQLMSTLSQYPNYLSYFNEMIGGPEGGARYVRGSDVDWGQGLKALGDYVRQNQLPQVSLDYFGTGDPTYYGVTYEPLSEAEFIKPERKIYAISRFKPERVQWTQGRRPTTVVGGAINIYDLR